MEKAVQRPSLKINYERVIFGAVAVSGVITAVIAMLFNTMGIFSAKASRQYPSKYPFELTDPNLQKVNFTVLNRDINTIYAEVRPLIAPSGDVLFFSRRNFPGNVYGEADRQDIWVSVRQDNGLWGTPVNLGSKINSRKADAICSVSPDGTEIISFNEQLDPAHILYRSKLTKDGWSDPTSIEIEDFYNFDPYVDFYYSFSSKVLLMAVSRNDSRGGQDLYVSFPAGKDKWSKPQSLGGIVNSDKSDFAPFLAADGKTLYFASYGHEGFGGCDIFVTTRLDDTWKNWSEPKNLGEGINSPREESYFSISGDYKYIYFESYDATKQVRDIFRADLPQEAKPIMLSLAN